MSSVIQLQGTRFNTAIDNKDVIAIKNAESRKSVESIWGKIKDWLCGTKKEQAKLAVYDLIHSSDNDVKISSFNFLKGASGAACQDRFKQDVTIMENGLYNINLSIEDVVKFTNIISSGRREDLVKEISHEVDDGIMSRGSSTLKQIKLDIPRAKYTVNGEFYNNGEFTEEKLDLLTKGMSDVQKKSLDVFGTQIGMIDLKNKLNELNKGLQFVGQPRFAFAIDTLENGCIDIKYTMSQNYNDEQFPIYKQNFPGANYPCLQMRAKIQLDTVGGYQFQEVQISHPGID